MSARERVAQLLAEMPAEPQYPSQGATLFVDLERQTVARAYTPLAVVKQMLAGRGSNMFYLHRLLDESRTPLDPDIPLIFGAGVLTGLVPSAARGNATSWSPESGVLMDSNCGDYFPSFMKMNGIDHIILFGRAKNWTLLKINPVEFSRLPGDAAGEPGKFNRVDFLDAGQYAGLDNIDMRARVAADLDGTWTKNLAMVNVTRAGENQVLTAGIMGGPKAIYARGGPGAKMGSLKLKAIVIHGAAQEVPTARPYKPFNREIAMKVLGTSVVKHALKKVGTQFLYRPSRLLGAMGTRNNQETTWTEELDAVHFDPFRPGMEGCFRCPVNCRPLNQLNQDPADKYGRGDGPEYVTLGKFGPNLGIASVPAIIRLNNICNDLGLDTSSTGSALAWAFELYQRGIINKEHTGGLELAWGDAALVERLLFMMAVREGFGNVLADGTRAVEKGHYPPEALKHRMAVKNLMQSDPHDARILKAFALGLAVATRGMDHLRNRVTLEINARINDDAAFKQELYGAAVSPEPNSYVGKEIAVRACENTYAVGDSVGMCRFTTKLFNSPSLPGFEQFAPQLTNVTGIDFTESDLSRIGLTIMGVERMINARLGLTRKDDTLPERWFEEPITFGSYAGEKIDRAEFDAMLTRFYEISNLDAQGHPKAEWRAELKAMLG